MGKFRELQSRTQLNLIPRSIDEYVSEDDGVRLIDEVIEELDLSEIEGKFSEIGRRAYSPRVLVKILAYGTMRGVRSSRELARATRENLRFIFLAQGEQPDFRTISDFRKNFHEELAAVLAQTVSIGLKEGLIKLEQVAIDGTKIRGFAGKNSFKSAEQLERELEKLEEQISAALKAGQDADDREDEEKGKDDDGDMHLPPTLRGKQERRERILKGLAELKGGKGTKRSRVSTTDPECRFMKTEPSYNAQAAVDVESGLVVSGYVTSNNNDTNELGRCVDEVVATSKRKPRQVVADAGYGTYEEIARVESASVEVFVPLGPSRSRAAALFTYNASRDQYRCIGGRTLRKSNIVGNKTYYTTRRCAGCKYRERCCPDYPDGSTRLISKHRYDAVADRMREKMQSTEAKVALRNRRCTVEPLFGVLKYCRGLSNFLLRGTRKVTAMWKFELAVFNIGKLAATRQAA